MKYIIRVAIIQGLLGGRYYIGDTYPVTYIYNKTRSIEQAINTEHRNRRIYHLNIPGK